MADELVEVKVLGLPELALGMDELAGRVDDTAPERLERVASIAAGGVRTIVPYRTGRLASTVKSALAKSQKKATVRIGARVPYAGWIEFGGTRGRPYVPEGRYLYPTALKASPLAVAAVKSATNDEIKGMRWKNPL